MLGIDALPPKSMSCAFVIIGLPFYSLLEFLLIFVLSLLGFTNHNDALIMLLYADYFTMMWFFLFPVLCFPMELAQKKVLTKVGD